MIFVVALTWKVAAAVPPNVTAVALAMLVPWMVTSAPTAPEMGVNPEIPGVTEKAAAEAAVPPGVVTAILPVVAPSATVAVIWVSETLDTCLIDRSNARLLARHRRSASSR